MIRGDQTFVAGEVPVDEARRQPCVTHLEEDRPVVELHPHPDVAGYQARYLLQGPRRHEHTLLAHVHLDALQIALRQPVGIGRDHPQTPTMRHQQHSGQNRARLVMTRRRDNLPQTTHQRRPIHGNGCLTQEGNPREVPRWHGAQRELGSPGTDLQRLIVQFHLDSAEIQRADHIGQQPRLNERRPVLTPAHRDPGRDGQIHVTAGHGKAVTAEFQQYSRQARNRARLRRYRSPGLGEGGNEGVPFASELHRFRPSSKKPLYICL